MNATKPFEETKLKALADEKFAKAYLEESLREGDMDAFKIALQDVAKVRLGMSGLAKETELGRETLYTTLSEKGNPRLDTLNKILSALGFKLAVHIDKPKKPTQKTTEKAGKKATRTSKVADSVRQKKKTGRKKAA